LRAQIVRRQQRALAALNRQSLVQQLFDQLAGVDLI
jgi:hypothetical protein